uniref:Enhancer of yellow 2 transcription factor n=1 Tax=Timema cristinae TaxID=61476 RepID=A0A7R9D642_TIMCR|nr:unnamed protein product [Timema cristinae]
MGMDKTAGKLWGERMKAMMFTEDLILWRVVLEVCKRHAIELFHRCVRDLLRRVVLPVCKRPAMESCSTVGVDVSCWNIIARSVHFPNQDSTCVGPSWWLLYPEDTIVHFTSPLSRLKTLLRERLVECGWKDQIHMMCRQIVKERGVNIKVDELIAEITPKARASVPDSVKKELLQKIKIQLTQDARSKHIINIDEKLFYMNVIGSNEKTLLLSTCFWCLTLMKTDRQTPEQPHLPFQELPGPKHSPPISFMVTESNQIGRIASLLSIRLVQTPVVCTCDPEVSCRSRRGC